MLRSIPIQEPLKAPVIQPLIQPFQPDPSLVLWLQPQRDDKWFDYSGKGNHGAIHNAVWKPTPAGVGLSFNGTDAYTDHGAGTSLNITDAITIDAWIKFSGNPTDEPTICGKTAATDGYYLMRSQWSPHIRFYLGDGASWVGEIKATEDLPVNEWVHIIATATKNGNGYLYKNGVDIKSEAVGAWTVPSDSLLIGYANHYGGPFNGTIGDVRIRNHALSTAENAKIFRAERARYGV